MDGLRDGGTGARVREEVALICDQLDNIRTTLETYGAQGSAALDRVLAALRHGEDPAGPLELLHEALLAAGDAAGLHGHARGIGVSGFDTLLPDKWVTLCPTSRCARHSWPDGPDTPHCRISDRPLRRERL
ncbi:hypothetical protein [Streptomyces sp. NBC_01465]|uniref:hypothetical protein n=1 Tax=Streptomyces sp. NBC_01465 TaxID=2903878 RepID=UPI002E36F9F0|nr:hypothetical protein [Streptomyces sp. NBC_01465]